MKNNFKNITLAETPFQSIQGEGRTAGRPCHFIRVAECNKNCYFCDTPYDKAPIQFDLENWLETEYKQSPIKNILVTGGEPLLFQPLLKYLTEEMDGSGRLIVESNGSLPIDRGVSSWARNVRVDSITVSPKSLADLKLVCTRFKKDLFNINFKLIYGIKEFDAMIDFLESSYADLQDYLWIMPLGSTSKELQANSKEAAVYCIKKGYKLSGRNHICPWKIA